MRHADHSQPLLAVIERGVDLFQPIWIQDGLDGVDKIHTMLEEVRPGFRIVPFEIHGATVRDTGSARQMT